MLAACVAYYSTLSWQCMQFTTSTGHVPRTPPKATFWLGPVAFRWRYAGLPAETVEAESCVLHCNRRGFGHCWTCVVPHLLWDLCCADWCAGAVVGTSQVHNMLCLVHNMLCCAQHDCFRYQALSADSQIDCVAHST
jgi:hypothetical protein